MSKFSSSLLFVGPSGVGPFHSPDWRVSWCVNLVEGGSNGPFWLPLPSFEDQRVVELMMIDGHDAQLVAESLVLLLAVVFGSENLLGLLEETHNFSQTDDRTFKMAPFWELAHDVRVKCVSDLKGRLRVGVVQLDAGSIFDSEVVGLLESWGLRVEAFTGAPELAVVEGL